MSVIAITAIVLAVFLALALLQMPIAFALGTAGVLGLVMVRDAGIATSTLGGAAFTATASYSLVLVPMFILMGMFVMYGGVAEDLFYIASRVFRRAPGGLGIATVMACAGFAAVTGSSVATVATIGRVSIREMLRYGYPKPLAGGIVATAGTLGVLIPPSVVIVVFGIVTGESIGDLLLGGIVPGIVSALFYSAYIALRRAGASDSPGEAELDRGQVPPVLASALAGGGSGGGAPAALPDNGGQTLASAERPSRPRRLPLDSLAYVSLLFAIVIGGMYTGVYTATEAGAIGAFAAMVLLTYRTWRRKESIRRLLRNSFFETASISSMVFALLVGGAIFTSFLVSTRLPTEFADWVTSLNVPAWSVVALFLLVLIPLGMFLDSISILLITAPLMYPVVIELGYSGVWFGILMVKMIEIGLITPPVGINAYAVAGASDELTVEETFRGIGPFVAVELLIVSVLFAFPVLTLWIPSLAAT